MRNGALWALKGLEPQCEAHRGPSGWDVVDAWRQDRARGAKPGSLGSFTAEELLKAAAEHRPQWPMGDKGGRDWYVDQIRQGFQAEGQLPRDPPPPPPGCCGYID
jgi:hypothetical protein